MHRKFTSMENSIFAKESISEYWSTKSDHKVNGMCICIEKKCIIHESSTLYTVWALLKQKFVNYKNMKADTL